MNCYCEMRIMLERLVEAYPIKISQYGFSSIMANSIVVRNAVLQPSCESELKHNHHRLFFPLSLFVVRWKQKSQQHHSALQKLMSVLRQCKRPYLELLGSEGKRKRHRVKQRGRQGGGTDKYISNILMSKTEGGICGVNGRGRK